MDAKTRAARQKWLLEMADKFDAAGKDFEEKTLEQKRIDGFIRAWVDDAPFFAKQFRLRAKVYDLDIIKNRQTDEELRAAAEMAISILKSMLNDYVSDVASAAIEAQRVEMEHILKFLDEEKEDGENDG